MFRNSYDGDNTTFSPQGKLHQVEYAMEAVKQGSAAIGLRSDTHAILLTLKRSTGELATYQKKMIRIDDHVGVAIAGLTSDARVLSNHMRQQAMQSKMLYGRPIPVSRIVASIAERAQSNTQQYGKRPYGVGFLVIGRDETGPHLYEFSPAGVAFEYYAHSIGARSQSAKTYLEKNFESYRNCDLPTLIQHGLKALRDTLQQDKSLTALNTSIAIIGPSTDLEPNSTVGAAAKGSFRMLENEKVEPFLEVMRANEPAAEPEAAPTAAAAPETEPAAAEGEAGAAPAPAPAPEDGDGDVQMQE